MTQIFQIILYTVAFIFSSPVTGIPGKQLKHDAPDGNSKSVQTEEPGQ